MNFLAQYAPIWPEMIVAGGGILLMLWGAFRPDTDAEGEFTGWLAILVLVAAAAMIALRPMLPQTLFERGVVIDGFGRFFKLLVLAGSAFALILTFDFMRRAKSMNFELPVLILFATAGMMMMVQAGDLISLYIGLELQSLALYVVAAIRRDDVRSSEAGLKYFVLGALSSGMLLYGCSLLYGFTGSTSFATIAAVAKGTEGAANLGLIVGLAITLIVGAAAEHFTDAEWLAQAKLAQDQWIDAVYRTSPINVATTFWTELQGAFSGDASQGAWSAIDAAEGLS